MRVLAVLALALAFVPAAGARVHGLSRLAAPRDLRVMSYYPSNAGWTEMWTNWEPAQIASDLDHAVALHANTVRAIINPQTFGYPNVLPTYADRLQQFVSLAADRGLHVQLTLFDWWYQWFEIRRSETWARQLLTPYVGDPRIAFIELRNELTTQWHVLRWARFLLPYVQNLMQRQTPVTISVAGNNPVAQLEKLKKGLRKTHPDFYDIHYFGGDGGATAYNVFARARALVAPAPLWIGETGCPTVVDGNGCGGSPYTSAAQEAAQVRFFETVEWAARANGLAPPGVWTLNDLHPAAIPNKLVRDDDPELHYGLYRLDGTPKPAADIVRAGFDETTPLDFNTSFEASVTDPSGFVVPAEWEMHGSDTIFTQDRARAAVGTASARITPYGPAGGTGSYSIVPPDGGVVAGERVAVRVSAERSDANGRVFLVIEWHDAANRLLKREASADLPADATSWAPLDVSSVAPRNAAYARIDLVAEKVTAPVWFDDVSFSR
jgi:hypothetical protein